MALRSGLGRTGCPSPADAGRPPRTARQPPRGQPSGESNSDSGGGAWGRSLDDLDGLGEMAGDLAAADLDQRRLFLRADVLGLPAAGPEAAAGGRVDRAGDVALEPDPLAPSADRRLLDVG